MISKHMYTHHRRSVPKDRTWAYRLSTVVALALVSLFAFSGAAMAESYKFNYKIEGSGSITGGIHSVTILGTSATDTDGPGVPGNDLLAVPGDCFATVTATPDTGWTLDNWEIRPPGGAPGSGFPANINPFSSLIPF